MYTKLYQTLWRARNGRAGQRLFELEAELVAHERLALENLRALQVARLQELVEHAYNQVPFYHQRFEAVGVRPTDIRTMDDLQHLPVLTKADLHANGDQMIATGRSKETLRRNATGGSTGVPVSFYQDGRVMRYAVANKMRYRRWHEQG